MASSCASSDILAQATIHFNKARPFMPMYIHLVLSALFPIYTGAHASLSRPSSAAQPDKKAKKTTDPDDEDEDEDQVQKMEGLSNKDAIILPITAGLVLAGLYFLIKKYGAEIINLIMGYYFSGVGIFSVAKLVNDAANIVVSFVFPTYYARQGSLWEVSGSKRKAVRKNSSEEADHPMPGSLPLPEWFKSRAWDTRHDLKQKYTVKAYIHNTLDLCVNATVINFVSAFFGLGTIIYVNTVSKPWMLTNLQGFAVSYSALQLMSPTTFTTGSLILGSLFFYDVWAVFFTPLMVTVAKNLDQPIKLVFPRPDEPSEQPGEPPVKSFSMLGLGDIVVPGIMIGLALRFDLYMYYVKKQKRAQKTVINASTGEQKYEEFVEKAPYVTVTGRYGDRFWTSRLPASMLPAQLESSFPKPYFTASMVGYVVGMLTTLGVMSVFRHAQPALLYLVPGVLTSLWGTGLIRGEVMEMWNFSEAVTGEQLTEDEGKEKKEADADKKKAEEEQNPKGLFERLWHEIWQGEDKKVGSAKTTDEKTSKSSKSGEQSPDESKSEEEKAGLLFHFSVARFDPKKKKESDTSKEKAKASSSKSDGAELEKTNSESESSEDAVVVSSTDVDDTTAGPDSAARYRTRSMRASR